MSRSWGKNIPLFELPSPSPDFPTELPGPAKVYLYVLWGNFSFSQKSAMTPMTLSHSASTEPLTDGLYRQNTALWLNS